MTQVATAVFVGKPGAGKTSLVHALSGLSKELSPTVAPAVFAIQRGGQVIHLWDTPGQDRFASVSEDLLSQANLVVACSCDGAWGNSPNTSNVLRVRTKDDLNAPWFPADMACSSLTGCGVRAVFDAIFELVGPPAADTTCCCWGCSLVATHSAVSVDQYRLDLLKA